MANIHGLSDLNNNGGGGGPGRGGGVAANYARLDAGAPVLDPEAQDALKMFSGLQGGAAVQDKRPRQENFWDMWKYTFCGNFKPYAIPMIFWIIMTIVYITSVALSEKLNDEIFLGPDLTVLNKWGAKNSFQMRYNLQLWRLVSPIFLSIGFTQYVFNSATLILLGFITEATGIGFSKMAIVLIGSAIGGNLFGAVCSPQLAVGMDVATFGLPASMLGAVAVNWHALAPIGMMRIMLIMMLVLLTLYLILITSNEYQTGTPPGFVYYDKYAHFGSFITGLFLGMMLMRRVRRIA